MYIIWKFLVQIIWFVCSVCCRYCYSLNFGGITTSFCCCCCVVRTSASSPAFVVCRRTSAASPASAAASYAPLRRHQLSLCVDGHLWRNQFLLLRRTNVCTVQCSSAVTLQSVVQPLICYVSIKWFVLLCSCDSIVLHWYVHTTIGIRDDILFAWCRNGIGEGWRVEPPPRPQLMSTAAHFWMKISCNFQCLGKLFIHYNLWLNPSTCKSIPTLVWIM